MYEHRFALADAFKCPAKVEGGPRGRLDIATCIVTKMGGVIIINYNDKMLYKAYRALQ
jgi:hypothetical protein